VCVILVAKEEHKFLIIVLIMRHILGNPSSQIKTKWKFSIVGILTILYKCHLQTIFFHKLGFCQQKLAIQSMDCVKPTDLALLWEVKSNLITKLEVHCKIMLIVKIS